jgi:hypothetical protein
MKKKYRSHSSWWEVVVEYDLLWMNWLLSLIRDLLFYLFYSIYYSILSLILSLIVSMEIKRKYTVASLTTKKHESVRICENLTFTWNCKFKCESFNIWNWKLDFYMWLVFTCELAMPHMKGRFSCGVFLDVNLQICFFHVTDFHMWTCNSTFNMWNCNSQVRWKHYFPHMWTLNWIHVKL